MPLNKLVTIVTLCFSISACSSKIASYIEKSRSFPHDHIITGEQISQWDFSKSDYCLAQSNQCISYFHAAPLTNKRISYSIEIESEKSESAVNLQLSRDNLKKDFSGTVILLHGFLVSKEFMLSSALYFRFLGFDVVIPDLLGHGESDGTKGYGVVDSEIISNLIDDVAYKNSIKKKNIYLLGNSMGALTAARISSSRQDISGLILQAPMVKFDQAAYNYAKSGFPLLSKIISESNIREGAALALARANIKIDDTKIKPLLISSQTPILIFASSSDSVAPHTEYQDITDRNIKLVILNDRSHPSMVAIGQDEHKVLSEWLAHNN